MAYMRLGDLLIAAGAITQEQLEEALTIQKQKKERLGDVLIESNIITERQLIEALQMQLGVDFIDLTAISIPLELAKFVPRAIAKKYNKTVLAFSGCTTPEASLCNQHGIDAFFPILHTITTLEEAMTPETTRQNLTDTTEQVFRLIQAVQIH